MRTAILASQNKNKIKEIRAILGKYGLDVITRDDAGIPTDDIEETGSTFEENSHLKASVIMDMIAADPSLAEYLDSPVIADDSGLMVDAIGGAPGVYSARYAGEGCTYDDNNTKLLAALEGVPESERTAKFVTVITLIYPNEKDVPEGAFLQDGRYVLVASG
jgi:XTP/dITP diphosphohydrolase